MAYALEGRLLEVCTCNVLCPCWIGEDPDPGTCDDVNAWRIDRGTIRGIDVSGLTMATMDFIPGNIMEGNWRTIILIDDQATPEQQEALLDAWMGKLGGPLGDLAELIGEVLAVERVPIRFDVIGGEGHLQIGGLAEAQMAPYRGPTGEVTTLNESLFSSIPGSPAYVAKASVYQRNTSQYGLKDVNITGHNAIQGYFRFAA